LVIPIVAFCLPREACELTHVLHPNTERSTPRCDEEGRHIYNGGIDGVALTNYDYFRILPLLPVCHLLLPHRALKGQINRGRLLAVLSKLSRSIYSFTLSMVKPIRTSYRQRHSSLFHSIHLFTLSRDELTGTSYLLPASLKPVPSYFVPPRVTRSRSSTTYKVNSLGFHLHPCSSHDLSTGFQHS
jgi:hypothetical protein